MRDYIKPYIDEEEIELEDVIAASGERGLDGNPDDVNPFANV